MEWTRLERLLHKCPNQLDFVNLSPIDAFTKFYKTTDHSEYKLWLDDTIKEMPRKLNTKAETIRYHGNKLYTTGHTKSAITFYTKSIRFALFNDIEYGKALANRSAAVFALQEYKECLKDIDACFCSKYPEELRSKVHLRKLQCYYYLNMSDEFYQEIYKLYPTFKDNQLLQELCYKFKGNMNVSQSTMIIQKSLKSSSALMNETFAYATESIKLSFNEEKGRHVVASKNINRGDILFIEKAFISAQIFKSEEELIPEICYHCLGSILYSSLPCSSCTYCLYCSEKCKTSSWSLSHQFECPGMIIWYELGQGLPALKFLMKGIISGFQEVSNDVTEFGGYINNYPFANSLLSHFDKRLDKLQLIVIALIIVIYLRNRTDFYQYIQDRIVLRDNIDFDNIDNFFNTVGGLLVKHMSQLFCNGSIIEQSNGQPVAAAIYPSISMMNHSCQQNISIDYDGCTAIVKATEMIPEGCEVFNNYGVDCSTDKKTRQDYLRDNFCFDCNCILCTEIIK